MCFLEIEFLTPANDCNKFRENLHFFTKCSIDYGATDFRNNLPKLAVKIQCYKAFILGFFVLREISANHFAETIFHVFPFPQILSDRRKIFLKNVILSAFMLPRGYILLIQKVSELHFNSNKLSFFWRSWIVPPGQREKLETLTKKLVNS